tara:strand:- start:6722 stop:7240 length:519 start_codon:yes stop_codon:yes gene_type:complete
MKVKQVLDTFGNNVVTGAKKELSKQGKNASKGLSNSLSHKSKESKNSFEFSISMEDYGDFVDKGVRGAGGVRKTTSKFKRTNNKGKLWKLKKVTNSNYKFGRSGGISPKHFTVWAKRKGLSPFAVAKSVYHTGLETTNFLTNPFNKYFKTLPEDVLEAYGLEAEEFLEFALK